jgi:hypothetical protein
MTAPERRKTPRVPVSMKVDDAEGKIVGFGYAQNISERGMAVDAQALAGAESTPDVGALLYMRFKLPKSEYVITARGRVVRVVQQEAYPQIAMEFIHLSMVSRREIRRYVAARLGS